MNMTMPFCAARAGRLIRLRSQMNLHPGQPPRLANEIRTPDLLMPTDHKSEMFIEKCSSAGGTAITELSFTMIAAKR